MSRTAAIALSTACLLGLVACTSGSPTGPQTPDAGSSPIPSAAAPESATPEPTVEPTVEPTPTPTPEVQDMSDPELGVLFLDVPDLTGDEADVYEWLATYNKEFWRTMTTNSVSPAFAVMSSSAIQEEMAGVVEDNLAIDASIGGLLKTRIQDVTVDGDTASGLVCDYYDEATFATPERTYTPAEAGFGEPFGETVTLRRVAEEDRWIVETATTVEGAC